MKGGLGLAGWLDGTNKKKTFSSVTPLCYKVSGPSDCLLTLIKVKKSIPLLPLLPQVSQESYFCLIHSCQLVEEMKDDARSEVPGDRYVISLLSSCVRGHKITENITDRNKHFISTKSLLLLSMYYTTTTQRVLSHKLLTNVGDAIDQKMSRLTYQFLC